jgi:hypothetical protein
MLFRMMLSRDFLFFVGFCEFVGCGRLVKTLKIVVKTLKSCEKALKTQNRDTQNPKKRDNFSETALFNEEKKILFLSLK